MTEENLAIVNPYPRIGYGISMALVCALCWAVLAPILELAVSHFTPLFIVWFRFGFSFLILFAILSVRKRKAFSTLIHPPAAALVAGVFLLGNYYGFMKGVQLGGSITAQILIQFGNVGLIAIGVSVFHEKLNRLQIWGLCLVFVGMVTFVLQKSGAIGANMGAVAYVAAAALLWSVYAAIQKSLSKKLPPQLILLVVFFVSALILSFFVHPGELVSAPLKPLVALILCGLNTLVAYGALAEALNNAPVSIVSPIIALNPLGTVILIRLLAPLKLPWLREEHLGILAYSAGVCAVIGVAIVVANRGRPRNSALNLVLNSKDAAAS